MTLDISGLDDALRIDREPDGGIIERLRFDDALDVPIELTDEEMWSNYINDDLYEMDKALRRYFHKMRYVQERNKGFRTAVPLVFAYLFGRPPKPSDSYVCRMLHTLMKYYCTSYTGRSTIGGRRYERTYKFSRFCTKNRRPYSLRLRIEEANERGNGKPFVPYGTGKDKRVHRGN